MLEFGTVLPGKFWAYRDQYIDDLVLGLFRYEDAKF